MRFVQRFRGWEGIVRGRGSSRIIEGCWRRIGDLKRGIGRRVVVGQRINQMRGYRISRDERRIRKKRQTFGTSTLRTSPGW
jgi:hypothetical protein